MGKLGWILLVLTAGIASSNDWLTAHARPAPYSSAIQFPPPDVYEIWWEEMQACSGLRSSMSEVSWFYMPDNGTGSWWCGLGVTGYCAGRYEPDSHSITVAEARIMDRYIVGHEMIHALGYVGHDDGWMFGERCRVSRG